MPCGNRSKRYRNVSFNVPPLRIKKNYIVIFIQCIRKKRWTYNAILPIPMTTFSEIFGFYEVILGSYMVDGPSRYVANALHHSRKKKKKKKSFAKHILCRIPCQSKSTRTRLLSLMLLNPSVMLCWMCHKTHIFILDVVDLKFSTITKRLKNKYFRYKFLVMESLAIRSIQ